MDTTPIEEYILEHISPEPAHLKRLYRNTYLNHLYPRMCSGHLQGRLLKMLTAIAAPKRVLELGTFTGYSALSIAEGLTEGCELHTIEIDDEMTEELEELFASSPGGDKITLHTGDALEIIPTLEGGWDMVFIDADKRHYIKYLEAVIPHLNKGALILADNTLWGGKVVEVPAPTDRQSQAIRSFNDYVASDGRFETVILPLRDGLTLLRYQPDGGKA